MLIGSGPRNGFEGTCTFLSTILSLVVGCGWLVTPFRNMRPFAPAGFPAEECTLLPLSQGPCFLLLSTLLANQRKSLQPSRPEVIRVYVSWVGLPVSCSRYVFMYASHFARKTAIIAVHPAPSQTLELVRETRNHNCHNCTCKF